MSCCVVVERKRRCLINQVGREEVDSFVGKCGKPEFSCFMGYLDHGSVWGVGILVVGRPYRWCKWRQFERRPNLWVIFSPRAPFSRSHKILSPSNGYHPVLETSSERCEDVEERCGTLQAVLELGLDRTEKFWAEITTKFERS